MSLTSYAFHIKGVLAKVNSKSMVFSSGQEGLANEQKKKKNRGESRDFYCHPVVVLSDKYGTKPIVHLFSTAKPQIPFMQV